MPVHPAKIVALHDQIVPHAMTMEYDIPPWGERYRTLIYAVWMTSTGGRVAGINTLPINITSVRLDGPNHPAIFPWTDGCDLARLTRILDSKGGAVWTLPGLK